MVLGVLGWVGSMEVQSLTPGTPNKANTHLPESVSEVSVGSVWSDSSATPVRRLRVHKTLGGDTDRPDYPRWPKIYIPYRMVSCSAIKLEGRVFLGSQALFGDLLGLGLHVGRGAYGFGICFFPRLFSFLHFLNCLCLVP